MLSVVRPGVIATNVVAPMGKIDYLVLLLMACPGLCHLDLENKVLITIHGANVIKLI
jgi:hypothetical protein